MSSNSTKKAWVIGHKNPDTDSIVGAISASHLYQGRGLSTMPVAQGPVSPESAFVLKKFNLPEPEVKTSVAGESIYLVDYSDRAQAPDDFDKAKLLGIIDHHKLGDVTSDAPLECYISPVGCSNTLIKQLHDCYNVAIEPGLAGAMLCAILSDTVLFKSPTCTPDDIQAAKELAQIAGVNDINALGMEMFKAKSNLNDSPRKLIERDFKDFEMGGKKIGIGQLEMVSLDMITPELKESLKKELKVMQQEGRFGAILILTDIMKEGSEVIVCSDNEEQIASALGIKSSQNNWVDGLMSRKKQVVPPLMAALK